MDRFVHNCLTAGGLRLGIGRPDFCEVFFVQQVAARPHLEAALHNGGWPMCRCVLVRRPGPENIMMSILRRLLIGAGFGLCVLLASAPRATASECDLFTSSSSCLFNGGIYNVVAPHPTGTGVIQSFLRVQQNG